MSRLNISPRSAKTARSTRTRVRLAAAAAACIALLASAAPAWAATNTVTIGSVAELTVKVAISVPVTIVCDPLIDPGVASTVYVYIKQANGKQISSGSGEVLASPGIGNLLICDGSTQNNIVMKIMPDAGSGPFKNGAAYATASFNYSDGMTGDSGNTGGAIKLH